MEISRRRLVQGSALGVGLGAAGTSTSPLAFGAPAVAAPEFTTVEETLDRANPGPAGSGYTRVVRRPGEAHVVRTDLGIRAKSGRRARRKAILTFAHLSDVHITDVQSPMRLEYFDRYDDPSPAPSPGIFSSAYRAHEMLGVQVAEAMVRAVNRVGRGPVTGRKLAFAIQTGDNTDNAHRNEFRWNIDVFSGGKRISPDSGDATRYEGVSGGPGSDAFYDPAYWHPEAVPTGRQNDNYKRLYGFPLVSGLLAKSIASWRAEGLDMEWYSVFGNHDGLVQGNFPVDMPPYAQIATGGTKIISPPAGVTAANLNDALTNMNPAALPLPTGVGVQPVTPDPQRRLLNRAQVVEEHFTTTGAPVGHGFTNRNRLTGTAYYFFDKGRVRNIVMDSVNPNGYADGSLDQTQFAWLTDLLQQSSDKIVLVYSHHTSTTMINPLVGTGGDPDPRVLGDQVLALLLQHENVVAWVNGHTHTNQIWAHRRPGATNGGLWEINTASHCDFPQQSRLIELVDNADGTLSIFATMLDHAGTVTPSYGSALAGPIQLAGLARELSANDPQLRSSNLRGVPEDRNVELLTAYPLARPVTPPAATPPAATPPAGVPLLPTGSSAGR